MPASATAGQLHADRVSSEAMEPGVRRAVVLALLLAGLVRPAWDVAHTIAHASETVDTRGLVAAHADEHGHAHASDHTHEHGVQPRAAEADARVTLESGHGHIHPQAVDAVLPVRAEPGAHATVTSAVAAPLARVVCFLPTAGADAPARASPAAGPPLPPRAPPVG